MGLSCYAEGLSAMRVNSALSTQHSALWNERGVALVVVLWIFVFLFVVAFDFSASVREDAFTAHRYAQESEGYYLALAGFERGLYELLRQFSQPQQAGLSQATGVFDGAWREEGYGDGSYGLRFIDEAGKVNFNRANEETLRRIFTNLGIEESRRNVLVDSILDWIDEDDLHRASGAESDYYLSLSPPYTAKNGPFDTVEELLWVRGVTPDLFYGAEGEVGLRDIFTVDSPIDRINLRTASAEVIHALVGLPLEKSRAFVEERKQLSESTIADLLKLLGIAAGDAALRQFVFVNPTVVTIEATGAAKDGSPRRQVRGVIRLTAGQQGYQLARWIDRDMIQGEVQNAK